jgi:hypothetical protein
MNGHSIFALATALAALTAATAAAAGAIPGPKGTRESVKAHATDVYHVAFKADCPAAVAVSGDGDTDLDLFIYNESGVLVASDTDGTDDCLTLWTPHCSGVYTIKVQNLGCIYNCYKLATN